MKSDEKISQTASDQELVGDFIAGDISSMDILVKRYLDVIYGFVFRLVGEQNDAQDLTQEVFIKLFRSIRRYDQKRSLRTYLFSIAKNTVIDFFRKKKEIPMSFYEDNEGGDSYLDSIVDPLPLADELVEKIEISRFVQTALDKLPLFFRMVLLLHYSNEMTLSEVATAMGKPLNTVKSWHRRGLAKLKNLLENGR